MKITLVMSVIALIILMMMGSAKDGGGEVKGEEVIGRESTKNQREVVIMKKMYN
jgi:preprotein translocase subunit SecG